MIYSNEGEGDKMFTQPAGFEPARGIPIGFQVQRLNHSATTALNFKEYIFLA